MYSSSSQETFAQFQLNLAQSILELFGLKFVQIEGPILLSMEDIGKNKPTLKYIFIKTTWPNLPNLKQIILAKREF